MRFAFPLRTTGLVHLLFCGLFTFIILPINRISPPIKRVIITGIDMIPYPCFITVKFLWRGHQFFKKVAVNIHYLSRPTSMNGDLIVTLVMGTTLKISFVPFSCATVRTFGQFHITPRFLDSSQGIPTLSQGALGSLFRGRFGSTFFMLPFSVGSLRVHRHPPTADSYPSAPACTRAPRPACGKVWKRPSLLTAWNCRPLSGAAWAPPISLKAPMPGCAREPIGSADGGTATWCCAGWPPPF